jgi:hypothetical protein
MDTVAVNASRDLGTFWRFGMVMSMIVQLAVSRSAGPVAH